MQYLLIVVLLCFLFGDSQSQCEVLGTDRNDVMDIHHCHQLYTAFEEALISNEDNLYTLQEVFFSSEHHPPSLLLINYQIENQKMESKNLSAPMVWSRSSLFKYVNPFLFLICEPTIIAIAFDTINAQLVPVEIDLTLSVNTSSVSKDVSAEEVVHVLSTMTSRIKAYTIAQDKLSTGWDGSNNGYTLSADTSMLDSWYPLVLSTAMLLVSSLALTGYVYKKVHGRIRLIEQRLHSLAVFYSIGIVTLSLNAAELMFSMAIFGIFTRAARSSSMALLLAITKGIYIAVNLVVVVTFAIIGWKNAKAFPRFSCCCCCCFTRSQIRHNLIHSLIFLSVSNFAFSLVLSICPTFLLIFVYPLEIVSLFLYVGTSLFCTIVTLAILILFDMIKERIKASSKEPSQVKAMMKPHAVRFSRRLLYILPCFAFIILMLVYIKILIKTDYTGSSKILQAISSLSPSLGLGVVGYYAKKWLKLFNDQYSEESSSVTEMDDAQNDKLTLVDDVKSKEQDSVEIELTANKPKDDDGESTQLLSEIVTVESNV